MRYGHFGWASLYWLIWLLMFLGPEIFYVVTNPAGTLSWTVWDAESINMAQPFDFSMWTATHWTIAITVWLLFAWLSVHFPFGLLR